MKAKILLIGALALFAMNAQADTLETVFFRADMTTAGESPAITGLNASARAILSAHIRRNDAGAIVSGVVDFDVDYNFVDNDGTFTGLHIHDGAVGVNGPVTINTGLAASDAISATGTGNIFRPALATSPAAIATLNSMLIDPSKHYVNLHTTTHTGGVVRAQLSRAEMRISRVVMDPANEVPAVPSDGKGTGNLMFLATRDSDGNINAGTVSFETTYSFGSPVTFTGWHIHTGGPGVNGAVVINTSISASSTDGQNVTSGVIRRRVDVTSGAALTALRGIYANATNYYLNIHTTTFTGGVMRGQLEDTVQNSYQISMTTDKEVPPITGVDASGIAKVTVYSSRNAAGAAGSATVIFDVNHTFPANTTFTGFHIHSGDSTVSGPVVINTGIGSGAASVVDADGVGNIYRTVEVGQLSTPAALTAVQGLLADPSGYYINLHTTTNASGAIRGQLGSKLAQPTIFKSGVMNSASYNLAGTSVAPGSIAAVFGTDLTNGGVCLYTQGCNPRFEGGKMSSVMGGTTATVNGVAAPIFYTLPGQIGIQIPVETTGSTATLVVKSEGQTSAGETISLEAGAPGIFSTTGDGRGAGSITHASGFLVTPSNPATRGEIVVLYATGLGAMTPAVATGTIAPGTARTAVQPIVTLGGVPAQVQFAGQSGCCVGLNQINFTVPLGAPTGNTVPVVVSVGGKQSNSLTIAISQ